MLQRWTPFVLGLGLLGILAMGCQAKESRPATTNAPSTSDGYLTPAPAAPVGERLIINTVTAPTPAPITTVAAPRKIRKPGSDENLPSWVPISGRLTVVEAPDLAENLGLVPQGTTKKNQARISVADALSQNAAAPASAPAPAAPSGIRSATWLASNGRVRHARR